jgi:hypothetical protein
MLPVMSQARILTIVRATSVAVVLLAMAAQAVVLADADAFDPTRFFAYFTIQSNLIGVAAFAWLLVVGSGRRPRALESLRGAAACYLSVTFLVVILLLSDVDVSLQLGWVDVVLHKLFPIVVVADLFLDRPTVRLTNRDALAWLVYPVLWLVATVARGAADGWYPYPFLDPAPGGYGPVTVTVAAITVGFLALAAVMVRLAGSARSTRSTSA